MRKNKIVVLALAGIILAVMASGTAFATSYGGTSSTYYRSPSDWNIVTASSGSLSSSYGSYLDWNINLQNRCTHSVYGQLGAYGNVQGTPYVGGFSSQTSTQTSLAPNGIGVISGTWGGTVTATSGAYYIAEWHSYQDGSNTYTLTYSTDKSFSV